MKFVLDPPLTAALRDQIVDLWVDATNTGGAVGFVGPVTAEDVRPMAEETFAGVTDGPDRLLIATDRGRLVALLFIVDNRFALKAHWRVLKRVMVLPGSQGRGYGATLMHRAAETGREMGLAGLQVTLRDGHGLDAFYAKLGYRAVGRFPGALRVAADDDRDEIVMWLDLR